MTAESNSIAIADIFEVAIAKTPIPTAPLSLGRDAENFGLHLLAAALRMPHVTRFTETLSLVDATHMARRVSVDLNPAALPESARSALRRSSPGTAQRGGIWIPLERHSRGSLAPVIVRDDQGTVVPRLTGLETSHALGSGLARLFRIVMDGHPDALEEGTEIYDANTIKLRSRWLCESAIMGLVERGTLPFAGTTARIERPIRATDAQAIRQLAIAISRKIAGAGGPLHELIRIASSQYFLVARIPRESGEVYLEYEAPLLPAKSHTRLGGLVAVSWLPLASSEFTLQYDLVVPRGVDSYHLNLEVPQDIVIRRFALTSDGDGPVVEQLAEDIRANAEDLKQASQSPGKIQEAELQGIASRMAELGRRRSADLLRYRQYIEERYSNLQGPGPWLKPWQKSSPVPLVSQHAFRYVAEAQRPIEALAAFAEAYENGDLNKLADTTSSDDLAKVIARLEKMEIRYDVLADNDPRENAVHTQWRRRAFGRMRPSAGPVRLRVVASLADDAPSLSGSVMRLLIALVLLVVGFRYLLYGAPTSIPIHLEPFERLALHPSSSFSASDAMVTVLLLVPGLLLTRLDFPSHQTVLGRLRLWPRYLAYAGVSTTYGLAVAVAALPSVSCRPWFDAAIYLLVLLTVLSVVEAGIRAWRRRTLSLRIEAVPKWLRDEVRRLPIWVHRRVTARFSTVPTDFNG